MATTPAQKETTPAKGLRRSLSVWAAVGLSLALMAPSMAANINPQGAAGAGRAVPLAFLIAAVGVLLVAYTFVRLCQYYQHSGSVYAFVGATLGPRTGGGRGLGARRDLRVLRGDDGGRGGHIRRPAARLARRLEEPAVLGADPVRRRGARAGADTRRAAGSRRHQRAADRGGVHGHADPDRHRGGARQAAVALRSRRVDVHLVGVQSRSRRVYVGPVPRRGVRVPVVRRLRGVRHARRGGAQPENGTSRGPSLAWRSSAASTSSSSPPWR